MKIATWNINSVNARLPLILRWFETHLPEVACFQELKCIDEKFPREAFESLGYNVATHGQKTYNGVAIISKYPIGDVIRGLDGDQSDEQARYIEAVIEAKTPVRIASIYVPNGNPVGTEKYDYKQAWLRRLTRHAKNLLKLEEMTVLCGDYNIIPHAIDCYKESAWLGDALFQPEVRAAFQGLKNIGLYDAYEILPPSENRYTFWDYQAGAWPKNEGIRIDHHLLSPQAADALIGFEIHKQTRGESHEAAKPSDHVPVVIEIKTDS